MRNRKNHVNHKISFEKLMEILEFHKRIIGILKIIEFHARTMRIIKKLEIHMIFIKIMNIKEFETRIMKIIKSFSIPFENDENQHNLMFQYENHSKILNIL